MYKNIKVFACKVNACLTCYLELGTGQPIGGNKLYIKAGRNMDFEKSCTISTSQSSNGDNCHRHKEAVTNENNTKEHITMLLPFVHDQTNCIKHHRVGGLINLYV